MRIAGTLITQPCKARVHLPGNIPARRRCSISMKWFNSLWKVWSSMVIGSPKKKSMIEAEARWTEDDLKRLKLIR
jgi:hypothetical protein